MKNMCHPKVGAFAVFCLFSFFSFNLFAQVGIGTTSPDPGSILDISSTDKGVLLPRVDISNLNTIAPLTSGIEGLLVYNTNTSTGPGFFYWNGTTWNPVGDGNGTDSWSRTGNAGITSGTHFLGTTNNQGIRFKTGNIDRFEITGGNAANTGRFQSFGSGSASRPTYSWAPDNNLGIYRINDDILGFSTNGSERMRISSNGDVGVGTNSPISLFHVSLLQANRPAIISEIIATNSIFSAGEFYNPNIAGGIGITGTGFYGVYGIPTDILNGWAGYFAGDVRTRDFYYRNAYSYSDRRIKQNFQNIDNGLDLIMKLKPQKYEKLVQIDNSNTLSMSSLGVVDQQERAEKEFGLIAQDVELILPELVSSKKTNLKDLGTIDLKAVNYNGLIPILIQAMQEQQAQIKALQEEIKILKN